MTDRGLLELAAKAAGVEVTAVVADGIPYRFGGKYWNPLTDDGDALRLAVKLGIHFQGHESYPFCVAQYDLDGNSIWIKELINCDPYAATRRAIVRAAAEIGRTK